jgi:electron transfer flavoprotein beta subunit
MMKILVCVKQVPDAETSFEIAEGSNWIREGDDVVWRMNRYDEYALEEAVLIKERLPGVVIDAVSAGPPRVIAVIKKALEKGADNGIHLRHGAAYLPPFATASLIADYARGRAYDLIFTGVLSEDAMQGQVGPMTAALLGIPCAVAVVREELDGVGGRVLVETEIDGGTHEVMSLPVPCLLTIQTGINRPRYPSLSNVFRAKTAEITAPEMALPDSVLSSEGTVSLSYPSLAIKGTVLQGTLEEKADELLSILHEKSFI